LYSYTPARPGDRTLVDALHPFIKALSESDNIKEAAEKSKYSAESTAKMAAKLGRSVYVHDLGDTPDPGAIGVANFLEGLASF